MSARHDEIAQELAQALAAARAAHDRLDRATHAALLALQDAQSEPEPAPRLFGRRRA